MKIEIEYKEVEALREEIKQLEDRLQSREKELESLNKDKLRQAAISLAESIFKKFHLEVFKRLGFSNTYLATESISIDHSLLRSSIGKNWIPPESIEIEFGFIVTEEYRRAFLRLYEKHDLSNLNFPNDSLETI